MASTPVPPATRTAASPLLRAEDVPDLVLLVEPVSLRVLECNRKGGALFGHRADALVGRSLADLVPGATAELLERALHGRHDPHPDVPLRVSFRGKDGAVHPVDITLARRDDGALVCAVRAISESARAAEREIVSIIGAVPAAIVTWSLEGLITSWNSAAEQLFGFSGDEATGQPLELLIPAVDLEALRDSFVPVGADASPPPREGLRRAKDGEVLVEETLFSVRDVAGRLVRLGAFYRDLSEVARLRRAAEAMSSTGRSTAPSTALSPAMAGAMEAARTAASEDKTIILLLGETGVGKSHLARFIHEHSPRRAGPFLEVGCAGLDPLTAESELFGHERGAFVGAVSQKRGLVEAAEGGTLLLDEVAELPLVVQGKLLTFLDTGDIRRVGGVKRLPADVRIVAATHHDLDRAVADGRFRKDLYFRLRVVPVTLPPLRARRDELPELAAAMIGELCRRRGLPPKEISPSARAALVRYEWPGNLRQLKNVLEHALIVGKSSTINVEDLPLEVRGTAPAELPGPSSKLDDIIRRHIESVLVEVGGNRTRAAQVLGIDRATLRRRLGE